MSSNYKDSFDNMKDDAKEDVKGFINKAKAFVESRRAKYMVGGFIAGAVITGIIVLIS